MNYRFRLFLSPLPVPISISLLYLRALSVRAEENYHTGFLPDLSDNLLKTIYNIYIYMENQWGNFG